MVVPELHQRQRRVAQHLKASSRWGPLHAGREPMEVPDTEASILHFDSRGTACGSASSPTRATPTRAPSTTSRSSSTRTPSRPARPPALITSTCSSGAGTRREPYWQGVPHSHPATVTRGERRRMTTTDSALWGSPRGTGGMHRMGLSVIPWRWCRGPSGVVAAPAGRYLPSSLDNYSSYGQMWCNGTLQHDLPPANISDPRCTRPGTIARWVQRKFVLHPQARPRPQVRRGCPGAAGQKLRYTCMSLSSRTRSRFGMSTFIRITAYNLLHPFSYLDVGYGSTTRTSSTSPCASGAGRVGVAVGIYFAAHSHEGV